MHDQRFAMLAFASLVLVPPMRTRADDPAQGGIASTTLCPPPQVSCPYKLVSKIRLLPVSGQTPPHLVDTHFLFNIFDPSGSMGCAVRSGELENYPTEVFGYTAGPCGGYTPPGGSAPYYSGLMYPFRDYLNSPNCGVCYPPGQYNNLPANGTVIGPFPAAGGVSPAWIVDGIHGQVNFGAYGLYRCNPNTLTSEQGINVYRLEIDVHDYTPRNLVIEMRSPSGSNTIRFPDGRQEVLDMVPGRLSLPISGGSAACARWTDRSGPIARQSHAMCYDSDRNVTILFGGYYGADMWLNDTWEWNGTTWSLRTPDGALGSPSRRSAAGLAYDRIRHRAVLFGGNAGGTTNNNAETWEWDGSAWTQRIASSPSPRYEPAMAFDSFRARTVLFGGNNGSTVLSGTWEWDGTTWLLRVGGPAGPSARYNSAMAYDSNRRACVLFGGDAVTGGRNNQTWEWSGTTWTARGVGPPAARGGHTAWFDSARNVTVIHGGVNTSNATVNDTWEFNGVTWTQRGALGPTLFYHASAYDSSRSRAVVFGGTSGSGQRGELYEWNAVSDVWTERAPTPAARHDAAMAYDSVRRQTVLFGGLASPSTALADTWVWDGNVWAARAVSGPTARSQHAMANDTGRGRTVLFGGILGLSRLADTWEWNGTGWTPAATTGPSARSGQAMAYDAARARTVLFGGSAAAGQSGETWLWNGTAWTLAATTGPAARSSAVMAYDASRGRIVLYGGLIGLNPQADTWEWNGTAWAQIAASGPGTRSNASLVYDPVRARCVLFGGLSGGAGSNDTWEWNGIVWAPSPYTLPPARYGHAAAYDTVRSRQVLFGGAATTLVDLRDTWELSFPAPPTVIVQPSVPPLCPGSPAVFSLSATGDNLVYQWRKDGLAVAGAVGDSFTIPACFSSDSGVYDCIVTNSCDTVFSNPATLTVCIADFNCDGGVDGADVGAFFDAWESGDANADVNSDGGIDGSDVSVFFEHWETGC